MNAEYKVTKYAIPGSGGRFKLALVSDLHEHEASWLLSYLKEEAPDLILIAGDTLERSDHGQDPRCCEKKGILKNLEYSILRFFIKMIYALIGRRKKGSAENAYIFLREAAKIAPVYLSLGNHEWYLDEQDVKLFKSCGITLLDNEDIKTYIGKTPIRIGGISTAYDISWLTEFSSKEDYKILLCHHPEYYEQLIKGTPRDCFNLILSGHCHGGQWRIGEKGVFAPGQGLFPKYCHGVYPTKDGVMIVSAGCANTAGIPRFGNPCELVIAEIT